MCFGIDHGHNIPRARVVSASTVFVFTKPPLKVGCDACVQRRIGTLEDIDGVHGVWRFETHPFI